MKIYLDTCCYGRLLDDHSQLKIVAEAAAIAALVEICRIAGHHIVGSMAVLSEIGEIRNAEKRREIEAYVDSTVNIYYIITDKDVVRAKILQAQGLGEMDSLHLAAAEAAGVGVLLTTDGPFLLTCSKKNLSSIRVVNPLTFLPEVIK